MPAARRSDYPLGFRPELCDNTVGRSVRTAVPRTPMPPRWLCVVIVAFWLAATGWLVWSELRDEFGPDEPPQFIIDLVDEAQPERVRIRWLVWQGDEPDEAISLYQIYTDAFGHLASPQAFAPLAAAVSHAGLLSVPPPTFTATTWIEHHEQRDDFTLHVRLDPGASRADRRLDLGLLRLKRMESAYRVDRSGRLLGTAAEFDFDVALPHGEDVQVRVDGEVRGGQFHSKYELTSPLLHQEQVLDPVPVSRRGTALMPTHPVHRLRGLRPGQTWTMPLVNPLGDAVGALMPGPLRSGPRTLRAHVLPELHLLPALSKTIPGKAPIRCLVIEYDVGDPDAPRSRTWVRPEDGLVLRQEAELFDNKRLVMQRDVIPDVQAEP
jgi:hypothetical protein